MTQYKILIVDDSNTALMMSKMVLRGMTDCTFITASNGAMAVEKAIAEKPDLILMDIVMPVMDGLEATKRIRDSESVSETPIIMLTTRAEMEFVETGFTVGCNDYVNKPVNAAVLIAKIKSLLP